MLDIKLVALFLLVINVASATSDHDLIQQYLPTVQKYCRARFSPQGTEFLNCYENEVKALPGIYNAGTLITACSSEAAIEADCAVLTQDITSERFDVLSKCMVATITAKTRGTSLTPSQAITGGAKRVDKCA